VAAASNSPLLSCDQSISSGRRNFVPPQIAPQRHWRALIKKNVHPAAAGSRVCAANSSTASTCPRSTPGNHCKKSSTVAPSSRFPKRDLTGTRVPRKTKTPLTVSGEAVTSGQSDQSNTITKLVPPPATRNSPIPRAPHWAPPLPLRAKSSPSRSKTANSPASPTLCHRRRGNSSCKRSNSGNRAWSPPSRPATLKASRIVGSQDHRLEGGIRFAGPTAVG
jgi:hypothetical protein